jgi:hypothetical protein
MVRPKEEEEEPSAIVILPDPPLLSLSLYKLSKTLNAEIDAVLAEVDCQIEK